MALKVLALNCTLKAGSSRHRPKNCSRSCSRLSANTMPPAISSGWRTSM